MSWNELPVELQEGIEGPEKESYNVRLFVKLIRATGFPVEVK